jgi:hypothetical protein
MSVITSAPPAAPLSLKDLVKPLLFMKRDDARVPCLLSVPGSSNLALKLFNVTATGTVKPASQGELVITLYGLAKVPGDLAAAADSYQWLPLAQSEPESIGGEGELPETMWMIQGFDLMIFTRSGKLQGTFKSNVAAHPQPIVDLEHHPTDIVDGDPLYIFAVGAFFGPAVDPPEAQSQAEGDPPSLCDLTLASFTMGD